MHRCKTWEHVDVKLTNLYLTKQQNDWATSYASTHHWAMVTPAARPNAHVVVCVVA
jgi:hypothetical protein